jgi:hypothetical protein
LISKGIASGTGGIISNTIGIIASTSVITFDTISLTFFYSSIPFPTIHPIFLPEKIDKVKSSGKGSGKSSNGILLLLRKTSSLTIPELSKKLNLSTRAVEKHIHTLKEAGKLKRMGSRKEGWWEIAD